MKNEFIKPDFLVLDGIRGIAAIYVVINHARGHLLIGGSELAKIKPIAEWSLLEKVYYSLLQFTALGSEFVILFFVLSGFSIAYSLRNQQLLKDFYLKRFIRLYPPYLFALLWAGLTFYLVDHYYPALNRDKLSVFSDPSNTIKNLLYVNSGAYIAQFWSLIHEVFFYLIIPFALLNKKLYYVVSLIIYLIGSFIPFELLSGNLIVLFFLKYNFYFTIGVYLFYNYDSVKEYFFIKNTYILYAILFLLFLSAVIINYSIAVNEITFILSSFASILLIVNFLEKKINSSVMKFLGEMSYTLYIIHFASIYVFYLIIIKLGIISSLDKITLWWIWPLGVLFSVLTAYPFYYLIERNTKMILNKIRKG